MIGQLNDQSSEGATSLATPHELSGSGFPLARSTRNNRARTLRPRSSSPPRAFTLIELILVMAILTMAVSVTAPTLSHFFTGRALDSEARRVLALTKAGQSRAVSEGVPMELWFDIEHRTYGLEAAISYQDNNNDGDSKAVDFELDRDVKIEQPSANVAKAAVVRSSTMPVSTASVAPVVSKHPNLPTIRFLPDGSVSDGSPRMLQLTDRDGLSLWVTLSRNRLNYEIRTQPN